MLVQLHTCGGQRTAPSSLWKHLHLSHLAGFLFIYI